jgi:Fur family ferric uptake transcriptional regulator
MDQLNELLREHNLRITPQRKAILQILNDCRGHHLETENIYERLFP